MRKKIIILLTILVLTALTATIFAQAQRGKRRKTTAARQTTAQKTKSHANDNQAIVPCDANSNANGKLILPTNDNTKATMNNQQRMSKGSWGGRGINLNVMDAETHLEFDCAHADITEPIILDSNGEFSAAGTFVREHGGPVRSDEQGKNGVPAIFKGKVSGDSLTLTIKSKSDQTDFGSYTVRKGVSGRLVKCL